jgi:hypothetical protein
MEMVAHLSLLETHLGDNLYREGSRAEVQVVHTLAIWMAEAMLWMEMVFWEELV